MSLPPTADVVVIGGGIAGVSAAAHLAPARSVVLVEAEEGLARHTTGRSAAQFLENYGGRVNRLLSIGSRAFFEDPPAGTTDAPLLAPRPMLMVGGHAEAGTLDQLAAEGAELVPSIRRIGADEALEVCSSLRPELIAGGVLEPDAADIDVMALHQCFVRLAREHDATLATSAVVTGLIRTDEGWTVETGAGPIEAAVVVDAAGAWVDRVAGLAGIRPVGAMPLRRTAFIVHGPAESEDWPLVYAVDDSLYFKPEAGGQLLVSPADETPDEAHDARPEELDVALALDRLNELTTLDIRHVRTTWAGLRTFVADRQPVIGPDDADPSFVWMAGQGGTGIQTAPAAGRLLASLVVDGVVPEDLAALGLTVDDVSPARPTLRRAPAEGRSPG
ncbi:MAG: FAD-binding oxidoreductase [Actinomycetota bacterium]